MKTRSLIIALSLIALLALPGGAAAEKPPRNFGTISEPTGDLRRGGYVDFAVTWTADVEYPVFVLRCGQNGVVTYGRAVEPVVGNGSAIPDFGIPADALWWPGGNAPITCTAELKSFVIRWHPVVVVRRIDTLAPPVTFTVE